MKLGEGPRLLAVLAAGVLFAGSVWAKATPDELARLGKSLTCTGGEKAGTASGVPEFTGKWLGTPPGIQYNPHAGQHPVDPYAGEKPLLTITAENLAQHAERLSEGQKAMFAKYPRTYRIPVYQGHRDFRFSDAVCAAARKNAQDAVMNADGQGTTGAVKGALPFPFPRNGLELAFNNLLPSRAFTEHTLRDNANVLADGSIVWGRADNRAFSQVNDPANAGQPLSSPMSQGMNAVKLPEREKGGVSVVSEPVEFGKEKRLGWSYDPGTRRVRQIPEYGFDQPLSGTGGKLTIDSDRLFNGSPERYNWKSLGKKEVYVPANAYKIHASNVKYADLLKPGHENPDYMRYELRRVWVLEASLKDGYRHMFGKRVLFLDEDTGQALMSDYYDARGQLWLQAVVNHYYAFDARIWHAGTSFYHDLNSGGYVAYNLFQERPQGPVLNKGNMTAAMFTPEAARNAGN
ncbi:UNVERIFIED_CONTAM: DUF1329 domain-containing protein [Comamonas sp. A-3]|uniref:DUF1329 domain-containing protein n=1 Tax=Comamonas TaxID=283 RepID=UPI002449CD76|nr:DUF1329 domain-containing protein [Comamonas thiooxydans]MDH1252590.1 DUF1329 domain-containing protein [Comamonas thiooxydans]